MPGKRIAMLFPGSLGRTDTPLYVPAHVDLLERLSQTFEITAYTLIKPDNDSKEFRCGNAIVKYVKARYDDPMWKKAHAFYQSVSSDHQSKPFKYFHGLKALPCGTAAVLLGKRFKKSSIVSLQGGEAANLPAIDYGDMRKQPLKSLTLRTCQNADFVTTLTKFQLESIQKNGLKRTDIRIIPFGADDRFYNVLHSGEIAPPYRFLHIGHLNRVKDQVTLLKAYKIISGSVDCRLRIIGADYLNGELQRLCNELEIIDKVEFLGYIAHQKLPKHFEWSHLLLHTSLFEGQGLIVAEAMAAGVPVCGTNVGLIADLAEHEVLSVPIGDWNAFGEKILDLLRQPERINSMRAAGLLWAKNHSAQWTADQFSEIYDSIGV